VGAASAEPIVDLAIPSTGAPTTGAPTTNTAVNPVAEALGHERFMHLFQAHSDALNALAG
jgi:hypothetical protein